MKNGVILKKNKQTKTKNKQQTTTRKKTLIITDLDPLQNVTSFTNKTNHRYLFYILVHHHDYVLCLYLNSCFRACIK